MLKCWRHGYWLGLMACSRARPSEWQPVLAVPGLATAHVTRASSRHWQGVCAGLLVAGFVYCATVRPAISLYTIVWEMLSARTVDGWCWLRFALTQSRRSLCFDGFVNSLREGAIFEHYTRREYCCCRAYAWRCVSRAWVQYTTADC